MKAGGHLRRRVALAVVAVLGAASACAGSGEGGVSSLSAGATVAGVGDEPARAAPTVIRMALSPDPIWQWLEDSGTRAAWERDHNVRFEVSHPFDQFAAFAGGHADVVLINALDVPKFVEQPERAPVVIGKYTTDRTILAVRRTSRAENLEDLLERRIAVESSLSSTLLWGLIADVRYGLDFALDGADFDLVTVDPAGLADLVMRGDVDACICTPDSAAPLLADRRLRALYDGRSAAEVYTGTIFGGEQFEQEMGIIADAFVVDAVWHDANLQAVEVILGLWDEGVAAWKRDSARIVADYPHLFAAETEAEVAWLADYIATNDWIVPFVHITPQEAEMHYYALDRLQDLGLLPADAARPHLHDFHGPDGSMHDHEADDHEADEHDHEAHEHEADEHEADEDEADDHEEDEDESMHEHEAEG
ncbi:MAG: hypothetical protein OXG55_13350 [bacterium]|nr:hypothetical protein [bacterium]